jgi:hypothetical protein
MIRALARCCGSWLNAGSRRISRLRPHPLDGPRNPGLVRKNKSSCYPNISMTIFEFRCLRKSVLEGRAVSERPKKRRRGGARSAGRGRRNARHSPRGGGERSPTRNERRGLRSLSVRALDTSLSPRRRRRRRACVRRRRPAPPSFPSATAAPATRARAGRVGSSGA